MAKNTAKERAERMARMRPGSQTEIYLATIAEQLEELLDVLRPAQPAGDEVALREPKSSNRDAKRAQAEVEKAKADADAPVVVETIETEPPTKSRK